MNTDKYQSALALAQEMFRISQDNPYAQTLENYKFFCEAAVAQQIYSAETVFHSIFLVNIGNNPIGFLNARIAHDTVDIDFICIDKLHRTQGLGQALLQKFEEKLIEESLNTHQKFKIFLEVSKENKEAIQFYKNNGFVIVNERKNYYANHEDAFVMQKLISN